MKVNAADYLVETKDLTKKYELNTVVDNLNLQVKEGTVYGLLGPNGAGKTTTILMLLGLTQPTSGQAIVAGFDSARFPLQVKSQVGYLPDNVGFYQEMSGMDNLLYTASLNGIEYNEAKNRIASALERVGLNDVGSKRVGEYSRGMRQRLGIADVLVKEPKLIILDEPTLGIDPEGVRELLKMIRDLSKNDGKTILISSHLLHQIQQICDEVGIFVKGRLIASGSINDLGKQLSGGSLMQLEVKAEPFDDSLLKIFFSIEGIENVDQQGDCYILHCNKDIRENLVEKLTENKYKLLHLQQRGISLDSIYLQYFQKEDVYEQHAN